MGTNHVLRGIIYTGHPISCSILPWGRHGNSFSKHRWDQRGLNVTGIILGCLLVLQLVVTIVLYLKILLKTYMSTIRVALRKTGTGNNSIHTSDKSDNEGVQSPDKIKTERRNIFSLPHAEDYEDLPPRTGTYMVNVPMTKVVICVSKQDIVCTASLSSQVASLIVTFILTIVGFSISGKIVTIDTFFSAYYCMETVSYTHLTLPTNREV